mgnify:CR=1 FL=1
MTDQVFVRGLALHAYHGVMQHEGKVGQTFTLDLILDLDLTEASERETEQVAAIPGRAPPAGPVRQHDPDLRTSCGRAHELAGYRAVRPGQDRR